MKSRLTGELTLHVMLEALEERLLSVHEAAFMVYASIFAQSIQYSLRASSSGAHKLHHSA
jgi:hypothetical protein